MTSVFTIDVQNKTVDLKELINSDASSILVRNDQGLSIQNTAGSNSVALTASAASQLTLTGNLLNTGTLTINGSSTFNSNIDLTNNQALNFRVENVITPVAGNAGRLILDGLILKYDDGTQFNPVSTNTFSGDLAGTSLGYLENTNASTPVLVRDNSGFTIANAANTNSVNFSATAPSTVTVTGSIIITANATIQGSLNLSNNSITNLSTPVNPGDAVNKSYADSLKNGIQWKQSVQLGTITALPVYTPAGTGVGKTLTANANGVLTLDGVNVTVGDRVLVKDEVGGNSYNNGIYVVTAAGDISNPYILTRSTDADTNADVMSGMAVFVDEGTVNSDSGFVLTTNDPITLDTTGLTFVQFASVVSQAPVAGDGISVSGTTVSARADTTAGIQSVVINSGVAPSGIAINFDPAGAISATASGTKVNVDNSTIVISGNAIEVPTGGITDTQLAATYLKADGSVGLSADWNAGSYTITAQNFTDTSLTSGRVTYAGASGLLQDSANFTFDGSFLIVNNIKDSGLTSGQVVFAGASGLLTDSVSLTFDGTYLTANSIKDSALTSGQVVFAGASGLLTDSVSLTFDGTYLIANSIKDSALTSGQVVFAGASGLLTDSSSLTFDGTYLTANSIKDSALTSDRLTYAGASGLLQDSGNLTYDGTTLTAKAAVVLSSDTGVSFQDGNVSPVEGMKIRVLSATTVDATVTEAMVDGNSLTLANGSAHAYVVYLSALCTGGLGGNTGLAAMFKFEVAATASGGIATVLPNPIKTVIANQVVGWDVNVTTTSNKIQFNVTGGATDNITWAGWVGETTIS